MDKITNAMKVYKIVKKKKEDQPFWEDSIILVAAANYANAEDKALNFQAPSAGKKSEIVSIQVIGETTDKADVFIYKDRW